MSDIQTRVVELQSQAKLLEQEVKTLRGRIANRDPKKVAALQKDTEALKLKVQTLTKIQTEFLKRSALASSPEEHEVLYQTLKAAAVEYFQQINLDPNLWKSIAS